MYLQKNTPLHISLEKKNTFEHIFSHNCRVWHGSCICPSVPVSLLMFSFPPDQRVSVFLSPLSKPSLCLTCRHVRVWFPWLDSETKLSVSGPNRETRSWHTHANKTHLFCSQTHREPVKSLDNCAPLVLCTYYRSNVSANAKGLWSSVELVQSDCFSFITSETSLIHQIIINKQTKW